MKTAICKHCGLQEDMSTKPNGWMGNHSRWCYKNPKRGTYRTGVGSSNALQAMKLAKERSGRTNQYTAAKLDGAIVPVSPNKGKPGTFKGKFHSEKTKKIMSERARESKHRRLQRNIVEYDGVKFDSSWEVRLAKKLDADNVTWVRPNPISYIDKQGLQRHYFPDFYLPDFNLYLDPKNPHAFKVQLNKIECLKTQYSNIIFLCSIDEIDKFAPVLALPSKQ